MAACFTQTGNRDAVNAATGSSILDVGERRHRAQVEKNTAATVESRADLKQVGGGRYGADAGIFVALTIIFM